MTPSRPKSDSEWETIEAIAAVRMLWTSARQPTIDEILTPLVLADASGKGALLSEVVAEDVQQRYQRGLACGLETYRAHWQTIAGNGPARRALLVGEFMMRASNGQAESVEKVRDDLNARHPELRSDIDAVATIALVVRGEEPSHGSPHAPGNRVGKYRLDALLGVGAFAHTWLAWDTELRRHVALKLLRMSDPSAAVGSNIRQRVMEEAAAAAGLEHPAIVRVHEAGLISGACFIDTQFIGSIQGLVQGEIDSAPVPVRGVSRTAEDVLRTGPLEPSRAAGLIRVIAGAIGAAHARGITHGDIKPANILLTSTGEPMLADFGLARIAEVDTPRVTTQSLEQGYPATAHGRRRVVGTPAYLSPEVARGEATTPLSDVFSLGCTLRALLTGTTPRPPVAAEGIVFSQLLASIGKQPLPPLTDLKHDRQADGRAWPVVPITLTRIVDRATAHEPSDRYTSADRFAADLTAFLEHRPVEADPCGPVGLVRLWVRRHRIGVLVTSASLLIAAALITAFIVRVQLERNRALAAERLAQSRREETIAANDTIMQVNRFVSRMFNSTRGQHGPAGFTVTNAIQLGASRVERTFADRPLAAAAVQHFLGEAAANSGDFATAKAQLGAALKTRRTLLGPTHPDTISTLRQWGEMLNVSGQRAEGAAVFAEIVQSLGEDAALANADGLFALARVGGAAMNRRELTEARRVLERVAEAYSARPSDGSADHQAALNVLVTLYLTTREFPLAEQTQRQIVALNTKLLGDDDISTLNSLQALGFVLRETGDAGKRIEARAIYADAITRYIRTVGETDRYTINTRLELALSALPDDPAAAIEQVNIVEPHAMALAPNQQNRLKFGWVRGQALVAAGRLDEAVVGMQQAFDTALAAMGPSDGWTYRTATLLAGTLDKLGRKGEAAAVRAKAATPPLPRPPAPAGSD